jgi:hypothetical protein
MRDEEYPVVKILTYYKGSLGAGRSTRWCTAAKNDQEAYEEYAKDGDLYVFVSKPSKGDWFDTNKKWQAYVETTGSKKHRCFSDFMDSSDEPISDTDFDELLPIMRKIGGPMTPMEDRPSESPRSAPRAALR